MKSVCRDGSHRWQVIVDTCGPAAAVAAFHKKHKAEDLPDGLVLSLRMLGKGEAAVDPLLAMQKDEMADLAARYPEAYSASQGQRGNEASSQHGAADVAEHRDGDEPGE